MKYIVFSLLILVSAGSAYVISQNKNEAIPDIVVIMKGGAYSQTEITIKKDQVVEWRNEGSEDYWPASNIHPSHGIYPEFDPAQPVKPGESWSFKFDRAGTWKFHDHLFPKEIKGEVIVN